MVSTRSYVAAALSIVQKKTDRNNIQQEINTRCAIVAVVVANALLYCNCCGKCLIYTSVPLRFIGIL